MSDNSRTTNQATALREKLEFNDFPQPTYEKWHGEVDKQLKGGSFEKLMITKTYEDFNLKPIYLKDDISRLDYIKSQPGFPPYIRSTNPLGYTQKSWEIAQETAYPTPEQFNKAILYDTQRGQTAVNIILDAASRFGKDPDKAASNQVGLDGVSIASLTDLEKALNGIDIEQMPVFIDAGISAMPFAAIYISYARKHGKDLSKLRGIIKTDPLRELTVSGKLPIPLETAFSEMAVLTKWTKNNVPELRTIAIDSAPYHNGGASAVEELAFAIATAVEYIRKTESDELSIDDIASRICFEFSLGSNFFTEIAKLRAARLLWSKVVDACGGNEQSAKMVIHARSSDINKTMYDPYVNMLRATTEAFAGITGGCDSLHAGFFDKAIRLPDEFSRRYSRNIQVILQQECHFDKVIDPAGGSWYIESLTDLIARKAWSIFQEIEKKGGMFKALRDGHPQKVIAKTAALRIENLAKRKDVLVGTNMYPNLSEKPLEEKPLDHEMIFKERLEQIKQTRSSADTLKTDLLQKISDRTDANDDNLMESLTDAATAGATLGEISESLHKSNKQSIAVEPVKTIRIPEIFEAIRQAVGKYKAKTGESIKVFLVNSGKVSQYKPRADFASGFFGVGGFEILPSRDFKSNDETVKNILDSKAQVVIFCSADDNYPEIVPALSKSLKQKNPDLITVVAGNPKRLDDSVKHAAIDEYIYMGVNVYETLVRISKHLEVIS
ncbi:MAG: acyl-CoA mutase large subunit family protein [candidate division Zixibacteria bacterium]|nr:acyl-CoA mutase large subunit family protein [candidate division Zixibacteria bacterium]